MKNILKGFRRSSKIGFQYVAVNIDETQRKVLTGNVEIIKIVGRIGHG